MKPTLALLVALTACIDTDLDQTEQALDGAARVRMFTISSGTAMSSVQTAPLGTTFTGFESVGGTQLQRLATERNADGRLSLFAIGGDGVLYGRYQVSVGGGWNPESWQSLGGGWIQQVITARNYDGRIELFVRNVWGNVFHRYQVVPNGGWNPEGWLPFGGNGLQTISAATRPDGRIEVLAVTADHHLAHRVQYVPNSGWDADWSSIGGSNVATVVIARGRRGMELVALDTSNNVEAALEDSSGVWSGLTVIGMKRMSQLVVGKASDGSLDLLAISGVNTVYELTQAKITFAWNPYFVPLYWSNVAQLAVANEADGTTIAFARLTEGDVFVAAHTAPAWGPLQFFGGSAVTDVAAIDQE